MGLFIKPLQFKAKRVSLHSECVSPGRTPQKAKETISRSARCPAITEQTSLPERKQLKPSLPRTT
eukprot:scaffold22577_cov122-Cylindrotheca_fusiformis.AAC.39